YSILVDSSLILQRHCAFRDLRSFPTRRSSDLGQQRRLELAVVLADTPDILLLDEPTNHLSLLLVTQMEAAIHEHAGTVLVASHDRWLRRGWTGETLHL